MPHRRIHDSHPVGEFIRQQREAKGWSQERLAEESARRDPQGRGVCVKQVSNIETGKSGYSYGRTLIRLDRALELSEGTCQAVQSGQPLPLGPEEPAVPMVQSAPDQSDKIMAQLQRLAEGLTDLRQQQSRLIRYLITG